MDWSKALDEFGINVGVLYTRMITEKIPGFVMPRIHYVMADPDAAMMFQVKRPSPSVWLNRTFLLHPDAAQS